MVPVYVPIFNMSQRPRINVTLALPHSGSNMFDPLNPEHVIGSYQLPRPVDDQPPEVLDEYSNDSNGNSDEATDREEANVDSDDDDVSNTGHENATTDNQDHTSANNVADSESDIDKLGTRNSCQEPPAKLRKVYSPTPEDLEAETCPICLDAWGNVGKHRLVALKCGHLFGLHCVEKWLKAQQVKDRSCPTCKSKASIKDIRNIYARKVVAADKVEITALEEHVKKAEFEKIKVQLELEKTNVAYRACAVQLELFRQTLMRAQNSADQPARKTWRFALEKNLEVSREGGCRVLTYNCRTHELYVSQKSTTPLFAGYGIRIVSCMDYKLGQFLHLHPKPIRDMMYSQPRDLLLTVGLDGNARIVDRGIPTMTLNAGMPLWSCSWDFVRSNEFFVGGVGGQVYRYDVRTSRNYIQALKSPSDLSPVASLCSTEFGLLCCQLNSCWLYTSQERDWVLKRLPVQGSFMSLCYDAESHRALITSRPSADGCERGKLTVCRFKESDPSGSVVMEPEETFRTSAKASMMTRATWVKAPDATWVAAHSESDGALHLHGVDGARTMILPSSEPASDVCAIKIPESTMLASLCDSRVRIYRAVSTNT